MFFKKKVCLKLNQVVCLILIKMDISNYLRRNNCCVYELRNIIPEYRCNQTIKNGLLKGATCDRVCKLFPDGFKCRYNHLTSFDEEYYKKISDFIIQNKNDFSLFKKN